MFTRISNSWELLKASARVLRADKELLVFPLVSGVGLILISLTFFVPFLFSGLADSILPGSFEIFGFIVIFIFYIVQYAVIFLSNTALVGAALIRLRGGDPTLSDGFRIAVSRIIPILSYAVICSKVSSISTMRRVSAAFVTSARKLSLSFLAGSSSRSISGCLRKPRR